MKKPFLASILVLFIVGCSSKFGYNNMDWLIHWYMDDYIELTRPQERIFDENIAKLLRWHRTQELSKYRDHLQDIRQDISAGQLDEAKIAQHFDRGQAHFERVREEVSPQVAKMATDLSDDQITYLFAALEKENREEEEEIVEKRQRDKDDILEDRVETITDDLEDQIGRLSDTQKAIVEKYAPQFKPTGLMWIAYRRNIQQSARLLFSTRSTNPDFEQHLIALMSDTDEYRSDEYKQVRADNRIVYLAFLSELVATVSDKQKRKLTERIDDIIDDLDDLMES